MSLNESIIREPYQRDLGGGLLLRRATPADTEALVDFNARVHSDDGWDQPNERVGAWVRDLLTKAHPTFAPADFTVVEETATGRVVSSLNLISQVWTYAGIPFRMGRPELVGTHPDFRQRGLVRAQFDLIHQWSAERGELAQAITGIPYYYRLFGYEMTVNLGGGRIGYTPHLPALAEGEAEPVHFRPAQVDDLPFIAETYEYGCRRYPLACLRDPETWRYELDGHDLLSENGRALVIISAPDGERLGFIACPRAVWGKVPSVTIFELKPGVSWVTVTPAVMRYLFHELAPQVIGAGEAPQGYRFSLGAEHPSYEAAGELMPRSYTPYAWYLRVPDLPAFLRHVAPALDARLADSVACGYTGEIKLTFYARGLRLVFEQGKLAEVADWQPTPVGHSGDAAFPGLTFLQALFGHRSLAEIEQANPDFFARGYAVKAVLNALFPKRSADIWPVS